MCCGGVIGAQRIGNNGLKKSKQLANQIGWYRGLQILKCSLWDNSICVGVFLLGLLDVPFRTASGGQCVCTVGEVR